MLWLLFFIIDIEHKWCKTFVNELYVLATTQKVRVIVSQTNSSQEVDTDDDDDDDDEPSAASSVLLLPVCPLINLPDLFIGFFNISSAQL